MIGALAAAPGTASAASIATGGAENATGSSVTLGATVTTDGANTRCYFQYSKAGDGTPDESAKAFCSDGGFSQTVSLDGAGPYNYRAVICHSTGTPENPCPGGVAGVGATRTFSAPGPDLAVSGVSAGGDSARVSGTINARGNYGQTAYAQYSVDESFSNPQEVFVSPQPSGTSNSPVAVTADLPNLAPATRYYVRFRSFVEHGKPQDFYSNVRSFQTGRYAQTLGATNVSTATATLNGEVHPGGVALSYRFFYGTDKAAVDNGTSASTPSQSAGSGSELTPVSANVTGLTPGTTYHVRIVGTYTDPSTQQARTVAGTTLTFLTQALACPAGQVRVADQKLAGTPLTVTGCFTTKDGSLPASGPFVGHGAVTLNGLTITPSTSTGTLTITPATRTIRTSGNAGVALLTAVLRRPEQGKLVTTWSGSPAVFSIGGLNPTGKLLGFPLGGSLTAEPTQSGGVVLRVSALGLPNLLGEVTAAGSVTADSRGVPQSAEAQVGGASIGPLVMPSLAFTWEGGRTWEAAADIRIPLLEQGIGATVTVTDNKLTGLSAYYALGIPIPLGSSGVFIDFLAAGADFAPPGFAFSGSVGGTAGPSVGGIALLRLDTTFTGAVNRRATVPAGLGDLGLPEGTDLGVLPFAMSIVGDFKFANVIPIGGAKFYYWGTRSRPLVALQGYVGFDLNAGGCGALSDDPAFQLLFRATLGVALNRTDFNLAASGQAKVRFLCATVLNLGGKLVVSNRGFGMCGYLKTVFGKISGGVGARWPSSPTASKLLNSVKPFTGCNLSPYTSPLRLSRSAARAAGGGVDRTFELAGGQSSAVLRFTGRGGPPIVTVRAPDGRQARTGDSGTVDEETGIVVLPDRRDGEHTTYVQIARPPAGRYRVTVEPGSPALTAFDVAGELAPARVRARVTGDGSKRTLVWRSSGTEGQTLVFRERGSGGDHEVLKTRRGSGRFRFRPSPGATGRRTLVVDVVNAGFPRASITADRFRVKAPPKPAQPKRLKLLRKGASVLVTWRAGRGAAHYMVQAKLGDGRKLVLRAPRARAVIANVGRKTRVVATVYGVNALGVKGRAAKATLKK